MGSPGVSSKSQASIPSLDKNSLHDLDYLDDVLKGLEEKLEESKVEVKSCVVDFRSMNALAGHGEASSRVDLDLDR